MLPTVPGEGHERFIREMREIHGRRAHLQLASEKKGGLSGLSGLPLVATLGLLQGPTLGVPMTLGLRQPPEHLVHGPGVDYTTDSKMLGLLGEAPEMTG